MRTHELRSDTDRYVLLLEAAVEVYDHRLDGHVRDRVDTLFGQFLTEATPESALEPAAKFPSPLRQLKDRGGQVRALATWCQPPDTDLLVVQAIYNKSDEDQYLDTADRFASAGSEYVERFESMDSAALADRVSAWRSDPSLRVVDAPNTSREQ